MKRYSVPRVEARMAPVEPPERLAEQRGGKEQCERHRDLGRHEHPRRTPFAPAPASFLTAEIAAQVEA